MPDDRAADLAGADHAHRAPRKVTPHLAGQRVVLHGGAQHDLVHLARGHQHQHNGIVGHALGRVVAVAHAQAQAFGGVQRQVVVADAAAGQVLDAHAGKGFQVFGPDLAGVGAHGVAAFGQAKVAGVRRFGRPGIVDAVLLAVGLAVGQLVKRAQRIKKDLHTGASPFSLPAPGAWRGCCSMYSASRSAARRTSSGQGRFW